MLFEGFNTIILIYPIPYPLGMFGKKCKVCDKRLEGYSWEHVDFMLEQHMFVHRKKKEVKSGNTSKSTDRSR